MKAYALTFVMMVSQMMIIPFISPILVANYGVAPQQLSWVYMAGGAATFFSSPLAGRLADRFGKHATFRAIGLFSMLPILFITHLPALPFLALLAFFPVFMVAVSSRMIPMQALLTVIPDPARRGAFLSVNTAIQSLGTGCGAWFGGLLLASSSDGRIVGYGTNGLIATALLILSLIWIGQVRPVGESPKVAKAIA
jgi:predicted MFS family arabinose efflux permease